MSDTSESESSFPCKACKEKIQTNRVNRLRTDNSTTIPLPGVYEAIRDYSQICSACNTYIGNLPPRIANAVRTCPLCKYFASETSSSTNSSDVAEDTFGLRAGIVDMRASLSTVEATIARAEEILQSITKKISNLNIQDSVNCNNDSNASSITEELHQIQHNTRMALSRQHGLNFSCDKEKKDSINMLIREMSTSNINQCTPATEPIQHNALNYLTLQNKINASESINTSVLENLIEPKTEECSSCNTDDLIQTITNKCLQQNSYVDRNDVALEQTSSGTNFQQPNLYLVDQSKNDRVQQWIETIPENNAYNLTGMNNSVNELDESSSTSSSTDSEQYHRTTLSDNRMIHESKVGEKFKNNKNRVNKSVQEYCQRRAGGRPKPMMTLMAELRNNNNNETFTQLETNGNSNNVVTGLTQSKTSDDTDSSSTISLLRLIVSDVTEETNPFSSVLQNNDYTLSSTDHILRPGIERLNNSHITFSHHDDEDRNNTRYEDSTFTNEEKENPELQ